MKILLCCSGGFSTSLVVSKMKEAAKQQEIEVEIWAVGEKDIDDNILKADIVMLAPQIAYRADDFERKCKQANKHFVLIGQLDYGRCNGGNILMQAINALS